MEGPITSGSVTLDASGRGALSLGPQVYGAVWRVTRMVTNVIDPLVNALNTRLTVYRNNESPSNMVDGTYTGGQDISETNILLRAGETLVFVWENGPVGGIATIVLDGESGRGVS